VAVVKGVEHGKEEEGDDGDGHHHGNFLDSTIPLSEGDVGHQDDPGQDSHHEGSQVDKVVDDGEEADPEEEQNDDGENREPLPRLQDDGPVLKEVQVEQPQDGEEGASSGHRHCKKTKGVSAELASCQERGEQTIVWGHVSTPPNSKNAREEVYNAHSPPADVVLDLETLPDLKDKGEGQFDKPRMQEDWRDEAPALVRDGEPSHAAKVAVVLVVGHHAGPVDLLALVSLVERPAFNIGRLLNLGGIWSHTWGVFGPQRKQGERAGSLLKAQRACHPHRQTNHTEGMINIRKGGFPREPGSRG